MADLGVKDALWLGAVVGSMVAVMASFVVIFLSGLDNPDVPKAVPVSYTHLTLPTTPYV